MRLCAVHLSPSAAALYAAVSDVCEVAQCAGWLPGTEYRVWQLLRDPRPEWGLAGSKELVPLLEIVGAAVQEAGCWIVWEPDAELPQTIRLGEWTARYVEWRDGRRW